MNRHAGDSREEKVCLLEPAGQSLRGGEVLQQIATEAAATADPDELLNLVVLRTRQVLEADGALLALLEAESTTAVVHAACGVGEASIGRHLPAGVTLSPEPREASAAILAELGPLPDGLAVLLAQGERRLGVLMAFRPLSLEAARRLGLMAEVFAPAVERALLARALAASERRYRWLVENAHDLIASVDTAGRFTFVNRRILEVGGYAPEELIGRPFTDLLTVKDQQVVLAHFAKVMAGGEESVRFEIEGTTGNGQFVSLDVILSAIRDDAGRVVDLLGIARDVTERKQREREREKLLARERQLRLLTDRLATTWLEAYRRLEALHEATKRLGESLELESVVATVFDTVRQLFAADAAAIYQRDESGNYVCPAFFGLSPAHVEIVCQRFTAGSASIRAVTARSPVLIEDLAADPSTDELIARSTAQEGIRTVLALPLFRQDALVGSLSIHHHQPRPYTDDEVEFAQTLTNTVALAIEKARLYEAERRARAAAEEAYRETEALYEATKQITSSLDLRTTLDHILDNTVRLAESDFAGLALVQADGVTLQYQVTRGPQADLFMDFRARLGEGLLGVAGQTGQLISVPDVELDPRWISRPQSREAGIRSVLCAPLRGYQGLVGVLAVLSRQPGHFVPGRERLLAGLADQAALAIAHAREVAERQRAEVGLRRHAHWQQAVAALGQLALAGPPLSALLDAAASLVARTLEVEYSGILELSPDGRTLWLRAGTGWREGCVGHVAEGTGKDSPAGYTLLSGSPVIVEDLRTETRFRPSALLLDHGVVGSLSVPLPGLDRLFGVLAVHTTSRRAFCQDEVRLLEAVANLLALVIHRKSTEEKLARLAAREERAHAESEAAQRRLAFLSANSTVAAELLHRLAFGPMERAESLADRLTRRERDVLRLLARGKTNREIARDLSIRAGTVKIHVDHIITKLGVANRTEAAVRAIELGLLSRER